MPLTLRGREILDRVPGDRPRRMTGVGCRIVRHDELCVGCGACARDCPTGASERGRSFDAHHLLDAPAGSRRSELGAALRVVMRHGPAGPVEVPDLVTVYRTIVYDDARCRGCGTCARACPAGAIEVLPPEADAAATPDGDARVAAAEGAGA